ncbi:hypothetical protein H0H92_003464, partial [Tricholoma furcatifolium]
PFLLLLSILFSLLPLPPYPPSTLPPLLLATHRRIRGGRKRKKQPLPIGRVKDRRTAIN